MGEELGLDELRDLLQQLLDGRDGGVIAIPDEHGRGFDAMLWREMAELGMLSLPVATHFGGLGLGIAHLGVLYEELGRHLASVPALPTMIVATLIGRAGSEAARARLLPAIAAGTCRAALALPSSAPLPAPDANGLWSGTIDHVLFADIADLLVLPVATRSGETRLAVIAAGTPGVTVASKPAVDLTRSLGRIDLTAVAVGQVDLIDMDQAGWAALCDHAALGLACDAIGGAEALFEITNAYLKVREQFGRPIGSFQALKHRMADWTVRIEAVKALVRHAATMLASGDADASQLASGAKAYACDIYADFAGDAVQLHGGIGFTWEHPCHLFLKRAKLDQHLFGDGKFHRDRVAELAFT